MDAAEKLDNAVKWCTEHAFLCGCALGAIGVQLAHWIF